MKIRKKILLVCLLGIPLVLISFISIVVFQFPIHNIMYGRQYLIPIFCKRSCDYLTVGIGYEVIRLQERYNIEDLRNRALEIKGVSLGDHIGNYQSDEILNITYTSPYNSARHEFHLLQTFGPDEPGEIHYNIYNACTLPNRTLKTEMLTVLKNLGVETGWLEEHSIRETCYAGIGL